MQDPIFKAESDFNLTDGCGKISNLSEHAMILIPFYYLPLLILILLIMKATSAKVYAKLIDRLVLPSMWCNLLMGNILTNRENLMKHINISP